MDLFLQQILNALSLGGTYALLALGLAVVFSIIGLINFAHGELMTVAGYVMAFSLAATVPFPFAIALAVAAPVVLAMAMERIAFRPVRGASGTTLLLTSFAVSAILRVLFFSELHLGPPGAGADARCPVGGDQDRIAASGDHPVNLDCHYRADAARLDAVLEPHRCRTCDACRLRGFRHRPPDGPTRQWRSRHRFRPSRVCWPVWPGCFGWRSAVRSIR